MCTDLATAWQLARPRRAGWCAHRWTPQGFASTRPRGATSRIFARGARVAAYDHRENDAIVEPDATWATQR
eukprot:COSAG06_NODE_819_length_12108_cov_4.836539_6_plen_71_part_00